MNPRVSIVIPVYNGSNYLKEAIDSALAQTYKNIEIIVVNDGSNDNGATEKIAKSYGKKIRYYKKKNGGVATALNLGIEKMTGDYFSWLSHDDMYLADRTKKMINMVNKEDCSNDSVIASSFTYVNGVDTFIPKRLERYTPIHPLSYLFLGYINGCSLLIPKLALTKVGVFNESLPTTQDFDLWFRILRVNKIVYLDERLTLSRCHECQGSKVFLKDHIKECDSLWISMMNSLSASEKSRIFGDELSFYDAVCDFLKSSTSYSVAISYANKKALSLTKVKMFKDGYAPPFIVGLDNNIKKGKRTIFFPLIGRYSERGGLTKMLSMVANRLSSRYNVIIASFSGKEGGYSLNDDISYVHVSTDYLGVDSFEALSFLFDTDIVVVSNNCSKSGMDLIKRMKIMNKKVIAWNHEYYFFPYSKLDHSEVWSTRNGILAMADAVLWLTNASCVAYSLRADNGMVLPNFIHFEIAEKAYDHSSVHYNIIAAARFDDPMKRIFKLLECYEKIIKSIPSMKLTILGNIGFDMFYKDGESIGEAINRINNDVKRIETVGFVDDVEKYYEKSDIHILPSSFEGFGLTILESAYYGVPTAVFNNSGFDEIITNGIDGVIVQEANTDALAQCIVELFNDKRKLVDMKKASKGILRRFSEDDSIKKWEVLIESLLGNKKMIFSEYFYDKTTIQKISNDYESALTEFSKIDIMEALKKYNKDSEAINVSLKKELSGVYNSKRWKLISKPIDLINKIIRERL